ncbi:hypothetical protein D6764_05480 [Candidatus Woesearchaeota archaeon]|nr:MAG: hypothetical protein D6764_05480 [Candidatus Woesearchaeota archaeon]
MFVTMAMMHSREGSKESVNMRARRHALAVSLFIGVLFLLAAPAESAIIRGNVYNYDLSPARNVRIDINTSPHQVIVVKDGAYSVEVPKGTYSLQSRQYRRGMVIAESNETVEVENDGVFTLDIIMFPAIEELDDGLLEDVSVEVPDLNDSEKGWNGYEIAVLIVVLALFSLVVYYAYQSKKLMKSIEVRESKHKSEGESQETKFDEDEAGDAGMPEKDRAEEGKGAVRKTEHGNDYENRILELIRQAGGTISQKDLRKEIPLSEAKISILVSALEAEGRIVKLKVGRGNIIKLKK